MISLTWALVTARPLFMLFPASLFHQCQSVRSCGWNPRPAHVDPHPAAADPAPTGIDTGGAEITIIPAEISLRSAETNQKASSD